MWYHTQVDTTSGRLAQLVEHLLDVQEVTGSSPVPSTKQFVLEPDSLRERVLPLFSATLRRVGVGTRVRAAVLLLYGFCPAVYGWDNVVLTESLSLSATVVFFFLIVRYIQERRFWDGAGALLVTLWLIFLRPQFLTYLAMLMVFFVWRMFYADKKEKKDLGILLAWGAVAALGIIVYL